MNFIDLPKNTNAASVPSTIELHLSVYPCHHNTNFTHLNKATYLYLKMYIANFLDLPEQIRVLPSEGCEATKCHNPSSGVLIMAVESTRPKSHKRSIVLSTVAAKGQNMIHPLRTDESRWWRPFFFFFTLLWIHCLDHQNNVSCPQKLCLFKKVSLCMTDIQNCKSNCFSKSMLCSRTFLLLCSISFRLNQQFSPNVLHSHG